MGQIVKLNGARVALSAGTAEPVDLAVQRGRLMPFGRPVSGGRQIDLTGHLLLPGLINAHDHLEFALFPRLGNGPWANASEWANAIYHPHSAPLKEHLSVPRRVRLAWGGLRNLLSGVTTVSHHNPWEPAVFNSSFPVRVVRRFGWAHSLAFSPDLQDRYKRTPESWPFIVHAAEGTDPGAYSEISRLDAMGVLGARTVLVHAVAVRPACIQELQHRGIALAWCPGSNLFTLGRTLSPATIRSGIKIALGTDSPLTAQGDLLDEMSVAAQQCGLTDEEIYPLVTTGAARVLRLDRGQGKIAEGGVADLVAVKDTGQTPAQALQHLHPELVLIAGRTMLVSHALSKALDITAGRDGFHEIGLEGRGKWLVRAGVPDLRAAAAASLGPEPIRLGGKRICR